MTKMFFPNAKLPTRSDVKDQIEKVYPGATILTYKISDIQPGEPLIHVTEEKDHEVSMAQSQLDGAAKNIKTLKKNLGKKEKNIPAWMQAKITDTAHNMDAAATYNEGAAWTRKEGQNKEGGLNEKGRKSYERENPGSDLKAPSKKVGNPRRKSFCARMKGMRKRQKPSNNTGDDRLSKSLRAWNC